MADSNSLIERVSTYVKQYMANYDSSHDYGHILRVLSLAHHIASATVASSQSIVYDRQLITLAALLHDVGDKKYLKPGEDGDRMVHSLLRSFGVDEERAETVQTICLHVSYTHEVKHPERVAAMVAKHPELAVVQDADRIDAIGAIGIARVFTFGGALVGGKISLPGQTAEQVKSRTMDDSVEHFHVKLEKIVDLMKTEEGLRIARERTEKLKIFRGWYEDEASIMTKAKDIEGVLGL